MMFKQNLSIYKTKRTTYYEQLMKNSKKAGPAVGTYTIKDGMRPEKMRGCFKSSLEKSSAVIDDAVYHSMQVPSYYKTPKIEAYKERSPIARMHAESAKEKEMKIKKWEKNNEPCPTTYQYAESF